MSYTPTPTRSAQVTVTTGFAQTVPDNITMFILNSASALASGTITMPANPIDGQAINIQAPKGILLVTISANTGQTFSASPLTVMSANQPYKVKYSGVNATWYPN